MVSSLPNDPQAQLKPTPVGSEQQNQLENALQKHQAGNLDEADTLYQEILNTSPHHADALHLKGVLQHQKGNPALAIDLIQSAIHLQPLNTGFYLNLAKVWLSQGDYSNALTQYAHVLEHTPDHPEALLHSAEILLALCETAQATETLFQAAFKLGTQCLALTPYPVEVAYNLARLYQRRHLLDQAIPLYENLLQIETVEASHLIEPISQNLGAAYQALGENTLAEAAFQAGLTHLPDSLSLNLALGMLIYDQGKQSACMPYFDTLIALEPENPLWRYKKNSLCPIFPESSDAIQSFRQTFEHSIETDLASWLQQETPPVDLEALLNLSLEPSFFLTYQGEDDLPIKSRLGDLWADALPRWYPEAVQEVPIQIDIDHLQTHPAERHIGMLITEKHEGIFIKLMSPLLNEFSNHALADDKNTLRWTLFAPESGIQKIQHSVSHPEAFQWVALPDGFLEKIQIVKQQALDALLYFEVGTDATNYFLPFFNLSPIQCTTWGVPVTTGIPSMQYFIGSQLIDPSSGQAYYREQLIRLETLPTVFPKNQTRFEPHAHTPASPPPLSPRKRLYLCPQNLFKLHPEMDRLFNGILEEDKEGEIHLISGRDPAWQEIIQNRMALTITSENRKRVVFLPRLSESEFLNTMAAANVILDPIHYGGGTTSLEALSVGTPMVILPSNHTRARMTLGCLNALCQTPNNEEDHDSEEIESENSDSDVLLFKSLFVHDETDYVKKAVWIAHHPEFKTAFQKALSTKQHHLFDDKNAAQAFDRFFKSLPQHPQKRFGLIQHYLNQKQWDLASAQLEEALGITPLDGELWAQLSYCQYQQQLWKDALVTTEQALSLLGENPILLNQKIRILQQLSHGELNQKEVEALCHLYEAALRHSPEDATSWHNYCCFLKREKQWDKARHVANQYQSQFPGHPEPTFHLGEIYFQQQSLLQAATAFQDALKRFKTDNYFHISPEQVWLQLGHVLNHPQFPVEKHESPKQDFELTAEQAYQQAVSLNPDLKEGWLALTAFYQEQNLWEKTKTASARYMQVSLPKHAFEKSHVLFSHIQQSSLRPAMPESLEQLMDARSQMALRLQTLEEMVYNETALPSYSLDELEFCQAEPNFYWIYDETPQLENRKRYAQLFEHWLKTVHPDTNQWAPEGVGKKFFRNTLKRIGFWVTEGHENVFHKLLLHLIEDLTHFKPAQTRIMLAGRPHSLDYLKHKMPTECLESIQWCPCSGGFTDTLTTLREQALDVMFWDEVGSQSINYFLAMLGVARYQVTANGYPITTGLTKMNFFLSAKQMNTPDHQSWFSETLVLLDSPPWQFHTPDAQTNFVANITHPMLKPLLSNPHQPILSCPQSLPKFHPNQDPVFAEILRSAPQAKLLLLESKHPQWNETLTQRFAKGGINTDKQIIWLPRLSFHDYLGLLQGSHLLLDTLAYHGSITSQEALTFGTPVITAERESYVSSVTSGCYRWLDEAAYLAKNEEDYVQKTRQQIELLTQAPQDFQHQKQLLQQKSRIIGQRGQAAENLMSWLETLP